ncbi:MULTISPECIES: murein hydrolase activator EnvC family protein [Myroides]|uniref:Peptidoglycan DD-metalloendopeptidase family protein n=1 Tax=Myroides albus TaxID=2562892 RepID=A0A6I3LEB9_9FLAO|nr:MULTISPECIES: M23 family metallopeptidase [Myroides]MTG96563.1 peptidoglycan DD-metalloendopeptidase family protein [Myroides albus]MVX34559.1 peptidoglycan DD-metalloendopeptidase family protein [Myroides sp. LoEW2-1]UVD81023.1 M23 family metallopeptidase [Myroides albus]
MSTKDKKSKRWKSKLLNKYRVVIVNDRTFEDVRSFKLNLLNVVGAMTAWIFLLILSTVILVVLTPVKEYIPGYSSADLKQRAIELTLKVDSLEVESVKNKAYLLAVKKILLGEVESTHSNLDSLKKSEVPVDQIVHKEPSEKDLKLREMVRLEDKYNLFPEATPKVNQILFSPIDGEIVKRFDPSISHFGLDFMAAKGTPVKAISKGIVLFVDWTLRDGYTAIVLHEDGIISVYKHLNTMVKEEYDKVSSGEVLGLFDGNFEDELNKSNKKYFHFELWKDTYPLDASVFIDIE